MFVAVVLALFVYSICEIEIQCSVIRRESLLEEADNSRELTKNLTLLKRIGDIVIQNESTIPSHLENKKFTISTVKNEPRVDFDGVDIPTAPSIDEKNRILISNRKNRQQKDPVGLRQPKFFGSLALLTGLGAASLANAASANANTIVKLFNSPLPLAIGNPGYFPGFYDPQHYLPFSYPVFYPVPRFANEYQNLVTGFPANPFPLPQQIPNVTGGKIPDKSVANFSRNYEDEEQTANENTQDSKDAATSQADSERAVPPEANEDNENELIKLNDEEESRQASVTPTTTTTAKPVMMNTTLAPNITVPTTIPTNITGSYPFYGYYGGSPQEVGHVILTTEDPQQRYVKDYNEERFSLPFDRPAAFNRYQDGGSYSTPFGNSFSPGEPFPEFLNTIESDRYVYDSENRPNYNGFRPILK